MIMNISIKIPTDILLKASHELDKLKCLRKQVTFNQYTNDKWNYHFLCDGFGNGYGVGCPCKEKCMLRITDMGETRMENGYLVQDEYFINKE